MKNLYYDEGPLTMSFGEAETFRLGVAKPVEDGLAETLLRKGRLKEAGADSESAPKAAGGEGAAVPPSKRKEKEG